MNVPQRLLRYVHAVSGRWHLGEQKENELRLALRPYVTAGIALVGASVIAVTPVAAPPPDVHTHAVQLSATAIDNPIEVFSPVFEKAGAAVRDAIQAKVDDPFPIVFGLIGKAMADGETLGGIASALGELGAGIATDFPPALAAFFEKAAAGDFTGAIGSFTPVFMGPFFGAFMQFIALQNYVEHQFEVAGDVTKVVMNMAWSMGPGQLLGVFQVMNAAAGALDGLAEAIPEGDPAKAFNAVQHGVANIASALVGIADTIRWSNDSYMKDIANILNPPPAEPEEPLGAADLPGSTPLALPAAEAHTIETPAGKIAGETAAPVSPVSLTTSTDSGTVPASGTTAVEGPETEVTEVESAAKPLVRDSLIAIPGKRVGKNGTSQPAARLVSEVSGKITATVDKIGDGVKKAFAKPDAKPEKKASAGSDGGSTGSPGASGGGE